MQRTFAVSVVGIVSLVAVAGRAQPVPQPAGTPALHRSACGLGASMAGKLAGQPVCNLLGGRCRDRVEMSGMTSIEQTVEDAVRAAQAMVERGFRTLKLKAGLDPIFDVDVVRAVRQAVGPAIHLRLDPNQAWTVGTTRKLLRSLEECGLQYVEQPVRADSQHQLGALRAASTDHSLDIDRCVCE